ncbi:M949_RS01915 family surface polysaccharide biosynthesis protein [Flavobacterium subsaxonicum]|uniref:Uncharacterized protein n=1 Tax=Flavobacterium subsaxonicum WB 4.1-42 = DSM 21790 TaxID=1121898 RepID=A0A0A2MID5_9FLAO|nr:hypothetical protein [Flavobacterium subsaxonicum]KGO91188.1 hypothetical protein Q766_19225 [Flavobacterium subsaxonicum WB 4.1-42 = DSM 21790]
MINIKHILFIILLSSFSCFAQIKTTPLDKASIPKSITYTGTIVNAVKYTDSFGETIVITSQTGIKTINAADGNSYKEGELFVYQYVLKDKVWKIQWKIHDFEKECMYDIYVDFIENTFAVTDLDKNGKAEIWVMYKLTCTSDVSPLTLKIIMYENGKKYAVRGESKIVLPNIKPYGGSYTFDEALKNAPKVFKDYATKLWNKNIVVKY